MCCVSMLWKTQHAEWICPFVSHATEMDQCCISAWIQLLPLAGNSYQVQGLSWWLKVAQDSGMLVVEEALRRKHTDVWLNGWTWGFPWVIWVMSIFSFSNLMVFSHVLCPFFSTVGMKGSWKLEWGVNKTGTFIGHDRIGKAEKSFQTST